MPTPQRAPLAGCPTPGSAAALESRLLKTWRRALHTASQQTMEAVARFVYGPMETRATKKKPARPFTDREAAQALRKRVELLDEVLEELLMMLQPDEQQKVAPLLLGKRNMGAFAKAVLAYNGAGNILYNREPEPKLDDSKLFKAAGLGRLAQQGTAAATAASRVLRGLLPTGGPPLVLVPPMPDRAPKLRTAKRRHCLHPLTLPGQLVFQWPPVSAARVMGGGL